MDVDSYAIPGTGMFIKDGKLGYTLPVAPTLPVDVDLDFTLNGNGGKGKQYRMHYRDKPTGPFRMTGYEKITPDNTQKVAKLLEWMYNGWLEFVLADGRSFFVKANTKPQWACPEEVLHGVPVLGTGWQRFTGKGGSWLFVHESGKVSKRVPEALRNSVLAAGRRALLDAREHSQQEEHRDKQQQAKKAPSNGVEGVDAKVDGENVKMPTTVLNSTVLDSTSGLGKSRWANETLPMHSGRAGTTSDAEPAASMDEGW